MNEKTRALALNTLERALTINPKDLALARKGDKAAREKLASKKALGDLVIKGGVKNFPKF